MDALPGITRQMFEDPVVEIPPSTLSELVEAALSEERFVIGLELERRHKHLLGECRRLEDALQVESRFECSKTSFSAAPAAKQGVAIQDGILSIPAVRGSQTSNCSARVATLLAPQSVDSRRSSASSSSPGFSGVGVSNDGTCALAQPQEPTSCLNSATPPLRSLSSSSFGRPCVVSSLRPSQVQPPPPRLSSSERAPMSASQSQASSPARDVRGSTTSDDIMKYLHQNIFGSQSRNLHGSDGSGSLAEKGSMTKLAARMSNVSPFFFRRGHTHALNSAGCVRPTFSKMVLHPKFEVTFAVLIVVNAFCMAWEAQYDGTALGYRLDIDRYQLPEQDIWWGQSSIFIALDWFFGVAFTIEVVAKLLVLGRCFFKDRFNVFDTFIQMCWIVDALSRDLVEMPIDAMLLRLARLARIMRLLKLAKTLRGLDPLFLMVTTLQGSMSALFWATLFLLVCQSFCAFVLYQIMKSYFLEEDIPTEAQKIACFNYFGTFSRALLSMFEITLGNFPPVARFLFDNVTEWFLFFSLFHKLSMGFAVIGVINGIFIQETFKVAACDDTIMFLQKERATKTHIRKMRTFFEKADISSAGSVRIEEWRAVMRDPRVCIWLAAQDLEPSDVDDLFILLGKGGSEITVLDLIQGVSRLKGSARSFDLAVLTHHHAQLMHEHQAMQHQVQSIHDVLCGKDFVQDEIMPSSEEPQEGGSNEYTLQLSNDGTTATIQNSLE